MLGCRSLEHKVANLSSKYWLKLSIAVKDYNMYNSLYNAEWPINYSLNYYRDECRMYKEQKVNKHKNNK